MDAIYRARYPFLALSDAALALALTKRTTATDLAVDYDGRAAGLHNGVGDRRARVSGDDLRITGMA